MSVELAEKIEELDGSDRYLDCQIAEAVGAESAYVTSISGGAQMHSEGMIQQVPRYTASLDAAMTLVPEGWGCFHLFNAHIHHGGELETIWEADIGRLNPDYRGQAATPALALCAAALRARKALIAGGE